MTQPPIEPASVPVDEGSPTQPWPAYAAPGP